MRLKARYQALLQLTKAIASHSSLELLFEDLASTLSPVVAFDCLALSLYDEVHNAMRPVILVPATFPRLPLVQSVPVTDGPAGWVWQAQRPRIIRPFEEGDQALVLDYARQAGLRITCWLPLTTSRRRLGVLVFGRRQPDEYDTSTVRFMERIAMLVAVAVENALVASALAETVEQVRMERDALQASERERVHVLGMLTERVKELTVLRQVADLLQPEGVVASEVLARVVELLPAAFQHPHTAAARIRYGNTVFATPQFRETPWVLAARFGTKAGLDGAIEVVYLEQVRETAGSPFLDEEQHLLDSLADMLQTALDRQAGEQALRVSEQRLQFLLDVGSLVSSELDYGNLTRVISRTLRTVVPHEYAGIAVFDAESRTLQLEAWTSEPLPLVTNHRHAVDLERSPAGIAFERGETMVFREAEIGAFGREGAPVLTAAGMKAACFVPLVTRRGKVGVLGVASSNPLAFSDPAEPDLLRQVAVQIAIAVENAVAYQRVTVLKNKLAEEKHYLEHEIRLEQNFSEIIGRGPSIRRTLRAVESVAPTDSTVLLLGETGTGKELLARAVHDLSSRRTQSFVRLNGAALPSHLIESELFGYERGAFTGATTSRMGRMELAHRGTLFLDEVGDVPLELQAKLLRVLQEREFERLGSNRTIRVDVRLIAATNRHLPQMVADGTFRSDLYYRLNVFPIQVPPLRERREDIPALVEHFAQHFAKRMNKRIAGVSDGMLKALMDWDWPGNIRELQNVIERAVILSTGETLELPPGLLQGAPPSSGTAAAQTPTLKSAEREAILAALRMSGGVVAGPSGAAARLGIKRTTLQARMRKLGIARPTY